MAIDQLLRDTKKQKFLYIGYILYIGKIIIIGFIAPKMVSYIRAPANRYHFKNNHYTPPTKKIV
nr:MAG TPA: hypothetical protein [Bacteriophage sp.]